MAARKAEGQKKGSAGEKTHWRRQYPPIQRHWIAKKWNYLITKWNEAPENSRS
jgi:hypothetical protein